MHNAMIDTDAIYSLSFEIDVEDGLNIYIYTAQCYSNIYKSMPY